MTADSGVTLKGFSDWFLEQAKYALFIILAVVLISALVKRAWIFAVGALLGLAIVGVFITNPDAIMSISEWLGGLLNIDD